MICYDMVRSCSLSVIYHESQEKPVKLFEAKSDLQVCVHVVTKILHEDIKDRTY